MLFNTALALLVLWILGLTNGDAMGGAIHLLLPVAIGLFLVNAYRERRAVARDELIAARSHQARPHASDDQRAMDDASRAMRR